MGGCVDGADEDVYEVEVEDGVVGAEAWGRVCGDGGCDGWVAGYGGGLGQGGSEEGGEGQDEG